MKRMTWIFMCVFVCFSCFCGCSAKDVEDQVMNVVDAEDEHVLGVKNGHPLAIPNITYGDAFDNFFGEPTWHYFRSTDNKDVVEFTGRCTYRDQEVKARLQFIYSDDGETFEQGALSFNDVPQVALITSTMIYKAFEEYAKAHDISLDDDMEDDFVPDITDVYDDATGELADKDIPDTGEYVDNDDDYDDSGNDEDYSWDDYNDEPDAYEYIFEDSDSRYLTAAEIKQLDSYSIRLARNEIYARHGRKFQDEELQDYFNSFAWYKGRIEPEDFDESVFNKYEKKNVKMLAKYE